MAFAHFLAMTAAELRAAASYPQHCAWMACHFSPDSHELCGIPETLPDNSLLILNDWLPFQNHDTDRICTQLSELLERFRCFGLLLDFQRKKLPELAELSQVLGESLSVPVCAPAEYAAKGQPVFLPPVPVFQSPEKYLEAWKGRDIWLESALSGGEIHLNKKGALYGESEPVQPLPFYDPKLFCHYRTDREPDGFRFSLRRSPEDLALLLKKAESLGVNTAVGLYQELGA